jgi:CysZ protein
MSITRSLLYGAVNVLHPRMLWLMLWPMLVALGFWGSVAIVLWTPLVLGIAAWLQRGLDFALAWTHLDLGSAALIAANVLLFLAFVPLVYVTALVILSVFAMQQMVEYVAQRSFPDLERRRGGGIAGSGWNSALALLGMVGLAVLTLPLWLLPVLWPVIPVIILAWGNQRLLRYDALAEHAERAEMSALFRARRGGLYLLGLLLAVAAYVPVLGFFAPVVFALAFIHYLLGALHAHRITGAYGHHADKELDDGNARL